MTIYAPHKTEEEKLADVIAQMRIMGAPTIRAVNCGDYYLAIEGSHRIAAAKALGLTPIIDCVKESDVISHDFQDLESPCEVAEICNLLSSMDVVYRF